jgi:hypothetical protein
MQLLRILFRTTGAETLARLPYVYAPGTPGTISSGMVYAAGMEIGRLLKGADPALAREICDRIRHLESCCP